MIQVQGANEHGGVNTCLDIKGNLSNMDSKTDSFSSLFCARFNSDEVNAMASYGDSETESDDDDDDEEEDEEEEGNLDDLENLDSVSIVAAKRNNDNTTVAATATATAATTVRRVPIVIASSATSSSKVAGPEVDSGRGDSYAKSGAKPPAAATAAVATGNKRPRPISAVPSEYSDISAGSSEGAAEAAAAGAAGAKDGVDAEEDPDAGDDRDAKEEEEEEEDAKVVVEEDASADAESRREKLEKAHRIAEEMLSTEEQYVRVLYLIDQVSYNFWGFFSLGLWKSTTFFHFFFFLLLP